MNLTSVRDVYESGVVWGVDNIGSTGVVVLDKEKMWIVEHALNSFLGGCLSSFNKDMEARGLLGNNTLMKDGGVIKRNDYVLRENSYLLSRNSGLVPALWDHNCFRESSASFTTARLPIVEHSAHVSRTGNYLNVQVRPVSGVDMNSMYDEGKLLGRRVCAGEYEGFVSIPLIRIYRVEDLPALDKRLSLSNAIVDSVFYTPNTSFDEDRERDSLILQRTSLRLKGNFNTGSFVPRRARKYLWRKGVCNLDHSAVGYGDALLKEQPEGLRAILRIIVQALNIGFADMYYDYATKEFICTKEELPLDVHTEAFKKLAARNRLKLRYGKCDSQECVSSKHLALQRAEVIAMFLLHDLLRRWGHLDSGFTRMRDVCGVVVIPVEGVSAYESVEGAANILNTAFPRLQVIVKV